MILLSGLAIALCANAFGAGELSNRRAPGFSLPDQNLKQHDLYDYRGRVVIIDVMSVSCPHCATFSKVLEGVKQRYGNRVQILSVVNYRDNQAAVKKYMSDHGVGGSFLFDCGQMTASYLQLSPAKPTYQTPHFFVIDREGWIREDFGYNPLYQGIFEGDGIYGIIDKYVGPAEKADGGVNVDGE